MVAEATTAAATDLDLLFSTSITFAGRVGNQIVPSVTVLAILMRLGCRCVFCVKQQQRQQMAYSTPSPPPPPPPASEVPKTDEPPRLLQNSDVAVDMEMDQTSRSEEEKVCVRVCVNVW